jgi:uncharacterized protein
MHWYEAVGLVALGLFAGGYGTMVGLGGGFLLVPAFLLLGYDARLAAGTSIFVVLANALSGTVSYLRQKRTDIRSGLIFAIFGIPGAWFGALVDQWLPQRLFMAMFAALLAWVGIRLLTTNERSLHEIGGEAQRDDEPRPGLRTAAERGLIERDFVDAEGVRYSYRYDVVSAIGVSLASGFVASLFGIGGGIVQVPAMVYMFGFPAHIATATSHMIIAVTSVVSVASHALYGDVAWAPAILVGIGAVVGAQIGARLARRVAPGPLMKLLAAAVIVTAAKLIWNALNL